MEQPLQQVSRRGWLLGLAGMAVAGCTSQPQETFQTERPPVTLPNSATPTPTPTPEPVIDTTPRWPLTGVPLKDGEEEKAAHAAVGVKVAVEMRSFPQSGVENADLVFVESQGNSYDGTRLCAVFHSSWPKDGANAVRSARPVDLALMAPLKAVIASTGATPWVVQYLLDHNEEVELRQKYGDRTDRWQYLPKRGGWWSGGPMPDKSVVAMPAALSRDAKLGKGVVPPVYLPYALPGEPHSAVDGTSAAQITIPYTFSLSGFKTAEHHRWDWDEKSGTWLASIRFPKKTAKSAQPAWKAWTTRAGKRVSTTNMMILFCPWKMGVIKGYSGHGEPIYSIINGGDKFMYFSGGSYVTGTWKKGKITDKFEFTLDDGTPLAMAPGKTWIEMPKPSEDVAIK